MLLKFPEFYGFKNFGFSSGFLVIRGIAATESESLKLFFERCLI